jgi:hypothetical protein
MSKRTNQDSESAPTPFAVGDLVYDQEGNLLGKVGVIGQLGDNAMRFVGIETPDGLLPTTEETIVRQWEIHKPETD